MNRAGSPLYLRPPARRAQHGQAAVLSALCLFSMVVFLALATNTGVLVNERIRIQNAADLAAYSGAEEQARKMNDIALINKTIQEVATYCRERLTYKDRRVLNDIKIWDQCMPETRFAGDVPELPLLNALPPQHALNFPPNRDTPPQLPGFGNIYGPSNECSQDHDSRADDLINWCERTIAWYASILYDINDYGSAYRGRPLTTERSSLLRQRPIFGLLGPGGQVLRHGAVTRTAQANYPQAKMEMLDAPSNSPVHEGRFYQGGVAFGEQYGNDISIPAYERPGGPSMVPLINYNMKFNYVFRCCSRTKLPCGPAQCGFPRLMVWPWIGPADPDGTPARKAYREFSTVRSYNTAKGMIYLPVRVWGNPADHGVPLLDNPSGAANANYFGGAGAWERLRGVAVAKPFEGYIGPSQNMMDGEYGVNDEMDPAIISAMGNWTDRPVLNGLFVAEPLIQMEEDGAVPYYTYRARMAGFREPLSDGTNKTMLNVLMDHVRLKPLPGEGDTSGYQYTAH